MPCKCSASSKFNQTPTVAEAKFRTLTPRAKVVSRYCLRSGRTQRWPGASPYPALPKRRVCCKFLQIVVISTVSLKVIVHQRAIRMHSGFHSPAQTDGSFEFWIERPWEGHWGRRRSEGPSEPIALGFTQILSILPFDSRV